MIYLPKDKNNYPFGVNYVVKDDYGRHWFVEKILDKNEHEFNIVCRNGSSISHWHESRLESIL